ncbi:N-6 DNA Methylase family protein [Francisella tularensis subsp. holarctica]|uniref:site-specific DNA-methyltransferase (adenine-specific) n=1 Tax=Francisella tularensis subsp. holarctica (strain LVS) TaxID=376619 RepID=A0AAI8BHD6_FRATH|nr:N-6 DNA Methylase family protein [Francisella tularensis subsp. holarctica]AJI59124.1 N-6 DNA Methylase family protein [Francisella tularensis subsp. holarctica LVS]AJI64825.1 N-6 DNA Methylase family protein [Francisella tularensis subsp. holarctica]AJI68170.1 N-6 DNA Methylase family protein [Francisella tularensis subsp. holarctica]
MHSKINRITDILRRDDGISGAMHYTEQVSWILFLKFLNDYENEKSLEAELIGEDYIFVLDEKYRWNIWAAPKDADGKLDVINADTGDDLLDIINKELFPYLKSFKSIDEDVKSIKYKIGAIFEFLDNCIASGHTLRDVINEIDELNFNKKEDLYQLSQIYENLLKEMGSDGGNSGEFYTPRPLVKAIVDVVNPQAGQTVYDPAAGTCGFLIDAYEHMYSKELSTTQLKFLNKETFFGKEKTPLSYVMGVMNMILHGITSPNINKANTLVKDIRSLEEKDRYNIILANPPFGGKEKATIQTNFPIKSNQMLLSYYFYNIFRKA